MHRHTVRSTMSVAFESFSISSPNPGSRVLSKRASPFPSPSSLRFEYFCRPAATMVPAVSTGGLGFGLLPSNRRNLRKSKLILLFAASHEESKPLDIEMENNSNLEVGPDESQEAWKQTLAHFKEEALKVQHVSQEAFELYYKKAMVILKETAEQLKIQTATARQDLSVVAQEISEESKVYLSKAAEKSPEPVKDIMETFATSTDELNELPKVRDFYLGIPYGVLLSFGGFLSFMLTGSISAIRFGVILGGTLLALSISSLRSWKKRESSSLALKGQAAIATLLFLREIRMPFVKPSFANFITAIVSGAMVAFYAYRISMDGQQAEGQT